jgi:hypothetical protein
MKRGTQRRIIMLGYNRRRSIFMTLFWPERRSGGFIFNTYAKGRSGEFKLHISNVTQYAERHGEMRVILFVCHAHCHKTKKV